MLYIDFGNSESLGYRDLLRCPKDFAPPKTPALARCCSLAGKQVIKQANEATKKQKQRNLGYLFFVQLLIWRSLVFATNLQV